MMIGITGFICWFSRFPEASKLCRMSKTTISGCPTLLTPSTGSLQSAGQPVYIELAAAAEPTHSLPWMSPIQLLHDGCTSHPTPINLKIPSLLFSKSHQKECLPNHNHCDRKGLTCHPFDRESMFLQQRLKGNIIPVGKAHGSQTLWRQGYWASLSHTQGHDRKPHTRLGDH